MHESVLDAYGGRCTSEAGTSTTRTRWTQNILIWILIGLVAGWLASLIVGGGGILRYIATGLIGSVVGGWLADRFNIRLNTGSAVVDQILVAFAGGAHRRPAGARAADLTGRHAKPACRGR